MQGWAFLTPCEHPISTNYVHYEVVDLVLAPIEESTRCGGGAFLTPREHPGIYTLGTFGGGGL